MDDFRMLMDHNPHRAAREKKKKQLIKLAAISAVIVVIVLAVFGFTYGNYTSGVKAYEAGDYEQAIAQLEKTPFGKTLYVKAVCKAAEQKLEENDFEAAYSILNDVDETFTCRRSSRPLKNAHRAAISQPR